LDEEGGHMIRFVHRRSISAVSVLGLVATLLLLGAAPAEAAVLVDCNANPSALQPAIDAASPGATLSISGTCVGAVNVSKDLTLKGNPATLDAQGAGTTLFVFPSRTVKVIGLTITGGTGTDFCGGGPACPFGAGVLNLGTLSVVRSTVSGNGGNLAYAGGGIYNGGTLDITRSTVSGNSAQFGGGVYTGGRATLHLTRSLVNGNSARNGGGIYDFGGSIDIEASTVSGNATSGGGGGISSQAGSTVAISSTTVSGNSAALFGGGILTAGALTMTGSTVSGNSALKGGGVWNDIFDGSDRTLAISSSTVSGNSAQLGGGIWNTGGRATLTASTVSANSASIGGGLVNDTSDSASTSTSLAASIDAGNLGGDCSGAVASSGYNLFGPDCAFSSVGDEAVADTPSAIGIGALANNGGKTQTMALVSGSPAVDAIPVGAFAADGVTPLCPASGTTDQRGVKRPRGPACDVGAYEMAQEAD
jgi:predicted outer membrane repeat protein